jgi:hypothetical protein
MRHFTGSTVKIPSSQANGQHSGLRADPNNPLYPQGKPDACVVSQKRSQRGANHASEARLPAARHFWPAALTLNSAIGGQVFARPHNDPVIRIGSKFFRVWPDFPASDFTFILAFEEIGFELGLFFHSP